RRGPAGASVLLGPDPQPLGERPHHLRQHALHGRSRVLPPPGPYVSRQSDRIGDACGIEGGADGAQPAEPGLVGPAGYHARAGRAGRRARCSGLRRRIARHGGRCGCHEHPDARAASRAQHRSAQAGTDSALDGGCFRGPDRGRGKEGRMSYRRVRAICVKELHHITRDSRSLAMALGVPVLMLLLFGYGLSLDVDRIPTMIYDQDQTAESRALIRQFQGSRFFEVLGMVNDYAAIEHDIDRSRILMGVVIPRNYSQELGAGREAQVQLLLDGSDSNTASIALGYAESLVRSYSLELRTLALNRRGGEHLTSPVDAQLRVWYNSSLESKNYVVPGLIAVVLQIIAALLTSLTIAREWEMGTMEQILSTPLRPAEMVLGKMAAYFA